MMLRALGWISSAVLLALCAPGCGSSTPAPSKAGLEVTGIGPGANATQNEACNVPTSQFGLYKKNGSPPSQGSHGDLLTDGSENATISCTVSGGGSTFHFNGSLQQGAASLSVNNGSVTKDASGNFTGTADMDLYSPTFNGVTLNSSGTVNTPCTITVSGSEQVAGGRIWASFDCSDMRHSPGTDCDISGVFAFADCDN